MGDVQPKPAGKWVVALASAAIAAAVALTLSVWAYHHQQVTEFRAAQKDCSESLTSAAAFLGSAAYLASRHAASDPGAPDSPQLVLALNSVRGKCFGDVLFGRSLTDDDRSEFDAMSETARAAWLYPDLPGRDGKPMKQLMFEGTRDYLAQTLTPKVSAMGPPSLVDTVASAF